MSDEIKWDIFVSHNRKQKAWVRKLVTQFKDLGISVFFDEVDIEPGESIHSAIDRGLRGSRHILLVISQASVESRWVAAEIAATMYSDPAADNKRLIPLLVEPCELDKLPLTIQPLNRINLTDPSQRQNQYHKLLKYLGVDRVDGLPDPPAYGDGADSTTAESKQASSTGSDVGLTRRSKTPKTPCFKRVDLTWEETDNHRNWARKNEQFSFDRAGGGTDSYLGEVIVGKPSPFHRVTAQFETSLFRKTKLSLNVCVSEHASLNVLAGGAKVVDAVPLSPGTTGKPLLHAIDVELTRHVDIRRTRRLEICLEYHRRPGTFVIPIVSSDTSEYRDGDFLPAIWQTCLPNWRAMRFLALGGMLCLTSFLVMVFVAMSVLPFIRSLGVVYPDLLVLVGWITSIVGAASIFTLARLRACVRYMMAEIGYWRLPLALVLLVPVVKLTTLNYAALQSAYVRVQYVRLINQYLDARTNDQPLRAAFRLNPWRIEAQILLDWHTDGQGRHRPTYVADLCESDEVQWVTDADLGAYRQALNSKKVDYFNDPLLWYATIRPQADRQGTEHRRFARDVLDDTFKRDNLTISPAELRMRTLVRALLEFEILDEQYESIQVSERAVQANSESEPIEENPQLAIARRNLLRQYFYLSTIVDLGEQIAISDLRRSHFYQEACDKLAQFEYHELHDASLSVASFAKIVEARNRRVEYNELQWNRSPKSLMLYYLFEVYREPEKRDNEVLTVAAQMLSTDHDNAFRVAFDDQFRHELKNPTKNPLEEGTAFEKKFYTRKTFRRLLQEGWRY